VALINTSNLVVLTVLVYIFTYNLLFYYYIKLSFTSIRSIFTVVVVVFMLYFYGLIYAMLYSG
jgi:hypothetical protein